MVTDHSPLGFFVSVILHKGTISILVTFCVRVGAKLPDALKVTANRHVCHTPGADINPISTTCPRFLPLMHRNEEIGH